MGTFNEVVVDGDDPLVIQFKHGMRWQYRYRIGDRITWDHLNRPNLAAGRLVIPGIGVLDPNRGDCRFYAIVIVDDVIVSVQEISETEFDRMDTERHRKT